MQLVYDIDTLCHLILTVMKRDLEIAALANKAEVANGQVDGH